MGNTGEGAVGYTVVDTLDVLNTRSRGIGGYSGRSSGGGEKKVIYFSVILRYNMRYNKM